LINIGSSTNITLEFYGKLYPNANVATHTIAYLTNTSGGGYGILFESISSQSMKVSFITSAGTYTITKSGYYAAWHRFTFVFSSANSLGYFYVDGVLLGTVATSGNLASAANFTLAFGDSPSLTYVTGFLDEIKIYSDDLTQDQVIKSAGYRNANLAYDIDNVLVHYWKCNSIVSNEIVAAKGGTNLTTSSSSQTISTTEYPTIKYGASFICGRFVITFPARCSLVYPIAKPYSDVNFEPILSWTDDDGVFHRRKLWTVEGVDYTPAVDTYAGEILPVNTTLEIWNIDGESTADLTEDLVLETTLTTLPTTSTDITAIEITDPTSDSTLAQAFPLTPFPLTFNTQQTYS